MWYYYLLKKPFSMSEMSDYTDNEKIEESNKGTISGISDIITFEILDNATVRGQRKLFTSDGYSYTVKEVVPSGLVVWRCDHRKTTNDCLAKLFQKLDGTVTRHKAPHCHPPDPDKCNTVKLTKTLKEYSFLYESESARTVAKKVLAKCMPGVPEARTGPTSPTVMAKKITYLRNRASKLENKKTVEKQRTVKSSSKSKRHLKRRSSVNTHNESDVPNPSNDMNGITVSLDECMNFDDHNISQVKTFKSILKNSRKSSRKRRPPAYLEETTSTPLISPISAEPDTDTGTDEIVTSLDESKNPDDYITFHVPKSLCRNLLDGKMSNGQPTEIFFSSTKEKEPPLPKKDPVDLFFESVAADIKDMPKAVQSDIKLEILAIISSKMHDNS